MVAVRESVHEISTGSLAMNHDAAPLPEFVEKVMIPNAVRMLRRA